jgi:glycosyltransferase involved in cell wall biosynthesis
MPNGIVTYTATMVQALGDRGVRCRVLTHRPVGGTTDGFVHGVHLPSESFIWRLRHRLDWEGWPQKSFANALRREVCRLHQTHGIELLEIEESYGWARFLARKVPVPVVVRLHGPWFLNGAANGAKEDAAFRRRHDWEMEGLSAADAVSAPSAEVLRRSLDKLKQSGRTPPALAEAIANPVERVPAGRRWKLQDCDHSRIVFVGRFDRHKGGDVMIDAFARVLRRRPDARLDFVGPDRGCMDETGRTWSLNDYLKSRITDTERERITIYGFQSPEQAARLRNQALVTVAPSRYETFSLAAGEAMMAGCPLVVSAAGALTELVQHDRNGLTARPDDPHDLANRILKLMDNPSRAAQLGAQAAVDAEARYAPGTVAGRMLEFYGRVLGLPKRRTVTCSSEQAPPKPASVSA